MLTAPVKQLWSGHQRKILRDQTDEESQAEMEKDHKGLPSSGMCQRSAVAGRAFFHRVLVGQRLAPSCGSGVMACCRAPHHDSHGFQVTLFSGGDIQVRVGLLHDAAAHVIHAAALSDPSPMVHQAGLFDLYPE